jgi:hypothetical protein
MKSILSERSKHLRQEPSGSSPSLHCFGGISFDRKSDWKASRPSLPLFSLSDTKSKPPSLGFLLFHDDPLAFEFYDVV